MLSTSFAAGIPDVGQARRLGHRLDKHIAEVYSHVADEVEARIQAALKQAWLDARHTVAAHPTPPPVTPRNGCIRRHLSSDSGVSNPARIVTGSTIRVPPTQDAGLRKRSGSPRDWRSIMGQAAP